MLHQFSLRSDSGGKGRWKGGDGVVREVEFTQDSHASVLTQRRVYSPYGMAGGADGERGINYLARKMPDGSLRWINVGGSKEVDLKAGDRIMLCTPGGGGYGEEGQVNGVNGHAENGVNGDGFVPRANGRLREYESNQQASN